MKTWEEILAEERAAQAAMEERETYKGYTVAHLRLIFNAVHCEKHWKNPWERRVAKSLVPVVTAAVEFFHADTPIVVEDNGDMVLMRGRGYQG